ncbi:MAG: hypothetical protein IPO91_20815 [Chloroflexi bacterium]|nr:hypothetical protein [Chloroflexota bacterium]
MSADIIVERLRRLLIGLAVFLVAGTLGELLVIEHFQATEQYIPIVMCVVALLALGAAIVRPQRWTLQAMRLVMLGMGLVSLLGLYYHVTGNFAFELEIRPNATIGEVFLDALGGANPLLAPGILGIAAVLALASTYYHPALTAK